MMRKYLPCICLLALVVLALAGCSATTSQERFFNHYIGQSEASLLGEAGPPDRSEDGLYDGHGLVYEHKTFQNRDYAVYAAFANDVVALVAVNDNQPETAPVPSFAGWRAANLVGADISNVLEHVGVPQLYIRATPPPGTPADNSFAVQTEYMEYQKILIDGVLYSAIYALDQGRVAGISFAYEENMADDDFKLYTQDTEQLLTELLVEPVWVRRLTENLRDGTDKPLWHLTKYMADDQYLVTFGGQIHHEQDNCFFVVFIYDIHATDAPNMEQITLHVKNIRRLWQDPAWEHGGDLNRLESSFETTKVTP